jgi:hypothetical protein
LDITLIKTKICSTCQHYSEVCTCKPENKNIVKFVDWIEEKYHDKEHVNYRNQCYKLETFSTKPLKVTAQKSEKLTLKTRKK